jgi:transposase
MGRRSFDVVDLLELFTHWEAGRSQAQIADSLNLDRKTVRKYTAPLVARGLVPGGPPAGDLVWEQRIMAWFPQVIDRRLRQVTWPQIEAHRDFIVDQLEAGVTVSTISQRLTHEHGLSASESSVRRWMSANLAEQVARSKASPPRPPVDPGSEAQIDYGALGSWLDPVTDRRRTVWAFVMVLSCSRVMFVHPVLRLDQTSWCESHVLAFGYFAGCPARLVPDNLKTGVDRPDLYDPRINRAYAELAAHYGVLPDPARVRKPKDKARVERAMPYVRDSFWRGRTFASLNQIQQAAVAWCDDVANLRRHRSLDGATPRSVFDTVEATALKPLPRSEFVVASWSVGKVGVDCHVKVGPALYSVPWRLIGQQLHARTAGDTVQILHENKVVATHIRLPKGRATDFEHYPPEKIAFHMRTPTWCRTKAAQIGPATQAVIDELMAVNAIHRLRSAQGIIGLADRPGIGAGRLEAACARALTVGDPHYKTIKGILAAHAETPPDEHTGSVSAGTPAFLRGPEELIG